MRRSLAVTAVSLIVLAPLFWADDAFARAGRGGSFGSRGSRSHAEPAPKPSPGSVTSGHPSSPPAGDTASLGQSPRSGLGAIGGFLAGGLLGGLLFGGSGGGIGLSDILGLGLLAYLAYRLLRSRSPEPAASYAGGASAYAAERPLTGWTTEPSRPASAPDDLDTGVGHIRQADPYFDKAAFAQIATDVFTKVQAAWSARDVRPISALLTPEMLLHFQQDCEKLKTDGRSNRIEDISVRSADVVEAWQEKGQDYVTARIDASLLDYTTDDRTGQVVEGSQSVPVGFEEYWTFTRPVWAKSWRLSAIQQPVAAAS